MSSIKGTRVSSSSIPESVRKTIQNIREITGAHEDEEIYAALKECSMDPNETTQRLLSQDTFHEVKRKRDRKKENLSNKESVEPRWKPSQGRGGRGGRGNYSSRYTPNDTEKSVGLSSSTGFKEPKKNEAAAVTSFPAITNGPSVIIAKGMNADISKSGSAAPHENLDFVKENPSENSVAGKTYAQRTSTSSNSSAAETQATSPGGYFSSSDPVLVPSHDTRIPGAAGTIKREVRNPAEQISPSPSVEKPITATSEVGISSMEVNNIQGKSIGVGKNQPSEATLRPSSAHGASRPSSNHSSRSQQVVGPPKVGSVKEWKPKSTTNVPQGASTVGQSEISAPMEVNSQSHPVTCDLDPKDGSTELQTQLEELHISDRQAVIIPNHLHVPGAEKITFCFGSFDAISLDIEVKNVPDDGNQSPLLETHQSIEETADQASSLHTALATEEEGGFHEHLQSPEHVPENISPREHDVPPAAREEYGESKQDRDLPQGNHQYPMIHASPGYGFGLMPTMMGSQLPPFDNSESQARDISRVSSYVVPQPFDPAGYYAQFYRSAPDNDGRISPLHAAGVATKYNGNVAVLPPQTSQSAQEGGNSVLTSTSGPNAFVTQPAAGVMPSSMAVTQQPVPVFRPPYGIPFPHYPHNFLPYAPYFSPYFVPHFNQSLNNSAYPQQPQAGGVYPVPSGPSPKISLPQYKTGTSSGNSSSVGVASSYGPYGPSASTAGNSTTNEDLNAQHFKESNVYITGQQQQTEGSAVWLTPPGRDISGIHANSFYNIPSQGQVAYPQPQPGHGPPYTGIYHTGQSVSAATAHHPLLQQSQTMSAASAVDIATPTSNIYQQQQQPQHAQVTWPNNNY